MVPLVFFPGCVGCSCDFLEISYTYRYTTNYRIGIYLVHTCIKIDRNVNISKHMITYIIILYNKLIYQKIYIFLNLINRYIFYCNLCRL